MEADDEAENPYSTWQKKLYTLYGNYSVEELCRECDRLGIGYDFLRSVGGRSKMHLVNKLVSYRLLNDDGGDSRGDGSDVNDEEYLPATAAAPAVAASSRKKTTKPLPAQAKLKWSPEPRRPAAVAVDRWARLRHPVRDGRRAAVCAQDRCRQGSAHSHHRGAASRSQCRPQRRRCRPRRARWTPGSCRRKCCVRCAAM